MSASVRQLASNRNDLFDPAAVRKRYPWLTARGLDCIVSPDADGLVCGLFMSAHFGWNVRGFYDGKVLVCDNRVKATDCVFLDMEIYRKGVRSVGQHMLLYNKREKNLPRNWNNFKDCFSINNHRGYDANSEFSLKYPFGTIHFLIAAMEGALPLALPATSIAPLLFIDGTYHNLFRYTENSLDWLRYLRVLDNTSPLHRVFVADKFTIHELMRLMDNFWEARDELSVPGERGDRVAITKRSGDGTPHNLVPKNGLFDLEPAAADRAVSFLKLLADATHWKYDDGHWTWQRWRLSKFEKDTAEKLTIKSYANLMADDPLSFAITSKRKIEYTLESPDQFQ